MGNAFVMKKELNSIKVSDYIDERFGRISLERRDERCLPSTRDSGLTAVPVAGPSCVCAFEADGFFDDGFLSLGKALISPRTVRENADLALAQTANYVFLKHNEELVCPDSPLSCASDDSAVSCFCDGIGPTFILPFVRQWEVN